MKYYSLEKAKARWEANYTWQPLLIAISIIFIVAISHKVHWQVTTETDPLSIWNQRITTDQNNETIIYYDNELLLNKTITFKGVLEIFPYTNKSIGSLEQANGTYDEIDGLGHLK